MTWLSLYHSAKFLKLEQVDQDVDATEMVGVSIDGTGQVGTYFYTAPEIEQGWPKINEKKSFFRRYEISYVYRKAVGHSPPNRYLQGDFDIVGGTTSLTEAEVIKSTSVDSIGYDTMQKLKSNAQTLVNMMLYLSLNHEECLTWNYRNHGSLCIPKFLFGFFAYQVTMDILTRFFHSESCDIHLNHGDLLEAIWSWTGIKSEYRQKVAEKSSPPGAVGTSIALETILLHSSVDSKSYRGGGLLVERMELVAELWEENIKAEFVPLRDPSLTEQYEYASEHDIKCLIVITDSGVSQKSSVKVGF
ncbi:UNVERIFIED_CONTAM: eIF-2-alpha kinase GCN2 [Sesamum angustifolium]|uniref:EIF-2-alpha kinase GCN2 n=1 Tax=Sesamum angustifolium TaxID=2727405 RepID=A0AAW2PQI4_9LAMI